MQFRIAVIRGMHLIKLNTGKLHERVIVRYAFRGMITLHFRKRVISRYRKYNQGKKPEMNPRYTTDIPRNLAFAIFRGKHGPIRYETLSRDHTFLQFQFRETENDLYRVSLQFRVIARFFA